MAIVPEGLIGGAGPGTGERIFQVNSACDVPGAVRDAERHDERPERGGCSRQRPRRRH